VQYKSIDNADRDIAYFKSIGLNKVRIQLEQVALLEQQAQWETLSRKFYDSGFYVIWGVSTLPGTGSADDWETYSANVINFVTDLATRSQSCSEFQIGNELELHVDGTTLTKEQLRANIRSLSTAVQEILTREYISYTCYCPNDARKWVAEGLGDLDYLGMNFYGNVYNNGAMLKRNYFNSGDFEHVVEAFGDRVRITEFNLDADNDDINSLSSSDKVRYMRQIYNDIKKSGVHSAYLFQYRGFKDMSDEFAVQLLDGTTQPYFNVLTTNGGRRWLT